MSEFAKGGAIRAVNRDGWERRSDREQVLRPDGSVMCRTTWWAKNPETGEWEQVFW